MQPIEKKTKVEEIIQSCRLYASDNVTLKTIFSFLELKAFSILAACSRNASKLFDNARVMPNAITFDTYGKWRDNSEVKYYDDEFAFFFHRCHSLLNFPRFCTSLSVIGALEFGFLSVLSLIWDKPAKSKKRVPLSRLAFTQARHSDGKSSVPTPFSSFYKHNSICTLTRMDTIRELCWKAFSLVTDSRTSSHQRLPIAVIRSLPKLEKLEFVECSFLCARSSVSDIDCSCRQTEYQGYMGDGPFRSTLCKKCNCTADALFNTEKCPSCYPLVRARDAFLLRMAPDNEGNAIATDCTGHFNFVSTTVSHVTFRDCLGADPLDALYHCAQFLPKLQSFAFIADGTAMPVGLELAEYRLSSSFRLTDQLLDSLLCLSRPERISLQITNGFPKNCILRQWLRRVCEITVEYFKNHHKRAGKGVEFHEA